jgi:uncharacterized membrane protein
MNQVTRVPSPWPAVAAGAALSLALFGLAWELWVAPLRPGGSWLALKVVPLLLACPGLWNARIRTFQWMSLAVWLYVGEALVRIMGLTPIERQMAWGSLGLSLVAACAVLVGARAHMRRMRGIA